MFRIAELIRPKSISEAREFLQEYPDLTVLGGCGFLKMGNRTIHRALDLSGCNLNSIQETDSSIRIGAMVSLREMETSPVFQSRYSGAIPGAIGNILGVQFRRCATIGASVYSKYGFSDILPVLLVLNTKVELIRQGKVNLVDFLEQPIQKDILLHVEIAKTPANVSYQHLRNGQADFPILNAAIGKLGNEFRIAIGARPARAKLAKEAATYLNHGDSSSDPEVAADLVVNEIEFGSNLKASAEYRARIAKTLVKRGIKEVLSCR